MITQSSPISLRIMLSLRGEVDRYKEKTKIAKNSLTRISALEVSGSKGELVREAKIALRKIERL